MENIKVVEKLQEIVNNQFDKILTIKIEGRTINIAIRKDQIPQLTEFKIESNKIVISFSNSSPIQTDSENFNLIKNEVGEIKAVFIPEIRKLKSDSYRTKLNAEFAEYIKNIPEVNTTQIIFKHKQKRMLHAISEIIKTVPNIV